MSSGIRPVQVIKPFTSLNSVSWENFGYQRVSTDTGPGYFATIYKFFSEKDGCRNWTVPKIVISIEKILMNRNMMDTGNLLWDWWMYGFTTDFWGNKFDDAMIQIEMIKFKCIVPSYKLWPSRLIEFKKNNYRIRILRHSSIFCLTLYVVIENKIK